SEIFQQSGEELFRKLECDEVVAISLEDAVIATGGGCFIYNERWMLQNGKVIFLRVPFATLAQRIGADATRPLWKNAEKLFAERQAIYEHAHHIVDASGSPTDVVNQILKVL